MVQAIDFDQRLREISMFFQENDAVHRTMARVVEKLERAHIAYAIVGGMAVNAHGYQRTTGDVDLLLTADGFAEFVRLYVPDEFERVANRPRRFLDRVTAIAFDILVTGLFPGSGKPGPIAYPDPSLVSETIRQKQVVSLATLIELKLAARRYRDFGDVVELIRVHNLDETFQAKLHPSVHGDFIECLEEKRREEEHELGQDEAFQQKTQPEPPPS